MRSDISCKQRGRNRMFSPKQSFSSHERITLVIVDPTVLRITVHSDVQLILL